jgi:hypothetical protein
VPMTAQIPHAPLQPGSISVTRRIRNDPAVETEQVPSPASFSKCPFETVSEGTVLSLSKDAIMVSLSNHDCLKTLL